uniref:Aquaporin 14 n=1 Tax=Xiphophorus maculatus TaxID=8083 RepID=A0A3B5QSC4_XIPMA
MFVFRCLRLVLRDVLSQSCLHHFLLEFVGTALFLSASLSAVLIKADPRSTGPTNHSGPPEGPPPSGFVACPLQVVLVFGLSVAMAALSVGGAVHLNPAVSIAMALTLRLRLWRAALYVIGQLLGGVASAALLLGLMGDVAPAVNQVSSGVLLHQAVTVETLITLQLVLVVMVTTELPLPEVATPLLVGLTVSLGHLVAVSPAHLSAGPLSSQSASVSSSGRSHRMWDEPSALLWSCRRHTRLQEPLGQRIRRHTHTHTHTHAHTHTHTQGCKLSINESI